jgi:hypothetical protein
MDKPPCVPVKGTSACPQASSVDKPAPAQNIVQKNHTCTTKLPTNSAYQAHFNTLSAMRMIVINFAYIANISCLFTKKRAPDQPRLNEADVIEWLFNGRTRSHDELP